MIPYIFSKLVNWMARKRGSIVIPYYLKRWWTTPLCEYLCWNKGGNQLLKTTNFIVEYKWDHKKQKYMFKYGHQKPWMCKLNIELLKLKFNKNQNIRYIFENPNKEMCVENG